MVTPSIDVDIETYSLIEEYVNAWQAYYADCLLENIGDVEFDKLPDGLKRLSVAYNNRISGLTIFLDGLHVQPLPFSEE